MIGRLLRGTCYTVTGIFALGVVGMVLDPDQPESERATALASIDTEGRLLTSPRPEPRTARMEPTLVSDADCRAEAETAMAKGQDMVRSTLRDQLGRGNVRFERPWVVAVASVPETGQCAGSFAMIVSGSVSGRVGVGWKAGWDHGSPLGRQAFGGMDVLDL